MIICEICLIAIIWYSNSIKLTKFNILLRYYIIDTFTNKIEQLLSLTVKGNYERTFKEQYKDYKFSKNAFFFKNIFNENIYNFKSTILYVVLRNILKIFLKKTFNYTKYNILLNIYLAFRYSISSSNLNILKVNKPFFKIKQYKSILKKNFSYAYIYATTAKRGTFIKSLIDIKETSSFKIIFSPTNLIKYINEYTTNTSIILYLRKNKIFNKSRYSRNRQTYRTGAYWCLYVNIIVTVALYFWFYKFSINFGYLWWVLYAFILSFFLPRAIKNRFYALVQLLGEYVFSYKWISLILISLFQSTNAILINYYNKLDYRYSSAELIKYPFSMKLNYFLILPIQELWYDLCMDYYVVVIGELIEDMVFVIVFFFNTFKKIFLKILRLFL